MKDDLAYWDTMEELLDGRLKRIKMTWKDLLAHNPVEYMPYDKDRTILRIQEDRPQNRTSAGLPYTYEEA